MRVEPSLGRELSEDYAALPVFGWVCLVELLVAVHIGVVGAEDHVEDGAEDEEDRAAAEVTG